MPLAVSVTFTFLDDKDKSSSTKIRVPNGFSLADYGEFAVGAAQVLANLSTARMTNCSFSATLDLSSATIRAAASLGADIAEKALFVVRSTVNGLFARFNIPTLNDAKVLDGTDQLDTADPDVAAMIAIIENGIDLGGANFIQPVDLRGNDLDEVSQTREVFRRQS